MKEREKERVVEKLGCTRWRESFEQLATKQRSGKVKGNDAGRVQDKKAIIRNRRQLPHLRSECERERNKTEIIILESGPAGLSRNRFIFYFFTNRRHMPQNYGPNIKLTGSTD